jgi:hypothetical protein
MTPTPVESASQTDWWQPYVPPLVGLMGSILVAVVALYSVRKSNGTNERAIDAPAIFEPHVSDILSPTNGAFDARARLRAVFPHADRPIIQPSETSSTSNLA